MSDTLPDIDRLEAVYDHILADPQHHSQSLYGTTTPCGAVYCFAGWAIVLFGESDYRYDGAGGFLDRHGARVHPARAAAEVLGLLDTAGGTSRVEGFEKMFGATTSLEGIRRWIDRFRGESGLPPREFRTDRNIELMERVWDHICEYPDLHDQWDFVQQTSCGTAHCFGGWALILAGYSVVGDRWYSPGNALPVDDFPTLATTLLGLTWAEAWRRPGLFDVDLTPTKIRQSIDRFRVEAGMPARTDAPTYVSC